MNILHNDDRKGAVFVDWSNFYTSLIKSDIDTPKNLRNYFLKWFDFSLVSDFLTGATNDVWGFYSGSKLGAVRIRGASEITLNRKAKKVRL